MSEESGRRGVVWEGCVGRRVSEESGRRVSEESEWGEWEESEWGEWEESDWCGRAVWGGE